MNLKVGIDADGVLTDMSEFLIREGKEFFKKQPKDSDAYSVDEMFEITKIQKIRFGLTVFDKYCKSEISIYLRGATLSSLLKGQKLSLPKYSKLGTLVEFRVNLSDICPAKAKSPILFKDGNLSNIKFFAPPHNSKADVPIDSSIGKLLSTTELFLDITYLSK